MKFDCGPSWQEAEEARRARFTQWHRWFAWYPVTVAKRDCRWLEPVMRRIEWQSYSMGEFRIFHYKPLDNPPKS